MIVQQNIRIRNRRTLDLALAELKSRRDARAHLMSTNAKLVADKWSAKRIAGKLINTIAPKFLGGSLAYVASLAVPGKGAKTGHTKWRRVLQSFLKTILPKLVKRAV